MLPNLGKAYVEAAEVTLEVIGAWIKITTVIQFLIVLIFLYCRFFIVLTARS